MRFWRVVGLVIAPFFIPAFYRDVARNWGGIGLIYLFLLFTIAWIPTLIKTHLALQKFAREDFPPIAQKAPDVKVKNGKVSSPVEQPFEIKDEHGNLVLVLDTTGKIKDINETKAVILITETKIFQRDPNNGQIQVHDLAQMQFPDFDFTKEWLQSWVDTICNWTAVCLYPIGLIGSFIRALIIMLLASIVGLIFNAVTGNSVSYGGLLRLGAVGLTTSVYIDLGMEIARWADLTTFQIPFWFAISLGITCIYVAYGVAVAGPPEPPPGAFDHRERLDRHMDDERDDDYPPRRRPPADGGPRPDDGGFTPGRS